MTTESKYVPLTDDNSEIITPAMLAANPDLRIEATWEIHVGSGSWEQTKNAGMRPVAVVKYRRPKPVPAFDPGPGFRLLSKDESLDILIDDGFTLGKWWPVLDNVCDFEAYRRPSGLTRNETYEARRQRPQPPVGYEIVTTLMVKREKIKQSAPDWWLRVGYSWRRQQKPRALINGCCVWLEQGEWCRPIVKTAVKLECGEVPGQPEAIGGDSLFVGNVTLSGTVVLPKLAGPALWATWPVITEGVVQEGDAYHYNSNDWRPFGPSDRDANNVRNYSGQWHRDPAKMKPVEASSPHADCGRGDENGPAESDCDCRVNGNREVCAEAGCGFCRGEKVKEANKEVGLYKPKTPQEEMIVRDARDGLLSAPPFVGVGAAQYRRLLFERWLADTSTSIYGPDMIGDDVAEDLNASELFALRARGVR